MTECEASYRGGLIVDKPVGITSHDVVARLRRITGERKIGHTGTLDPLASGVMVVLLGKAVKLSQFLVGESKSYLAVVRLGQRSRTFDAEGVFQSDGDVARPEFSDSELQSAVKSFEGEIEQQAPLYSAVKVDGERLYKAARRGERPAPPVRAVRIDRIEIEEFNSPYLRLRVDCGSGLYVRSLANDLGEKLGCGGYLSELRRTRVGKWELDSAHTLAELEALSEMGDLASKVIPPEKLVSLPSLIVADDFVPRVLHGVVAGPEDLSGVVGEFDSGQTVSVVDARGDLLAVGVSEVSSSEILNQSNHSTYRYVRVI